jgi:hypothetical protein
MPPLPQRLPWQNWQLQKLVALVPVLVYDMIKVKLLDRSITTVFLVMVFGIVVVLGPMALIVFLLLLETKVVQVGMEKRLALFMFKLNSIFAIGAVQLVCL